ncbi:MAG: PBP1A family penicillin-binding protein [Hellea sp.]|nr:PBP1A family penicillin-binding protein [Hellea sp.]
MRMETYRADIAAANDNQSKRRWRIIVSVLAILMLITTVGYIKIKAHLFEGLPELPDKQTMWELNLQPNITLLDKQGNILGHRGPFVGRPLKLSEMPSHLPNAFLAIEDERFYEHTGFDRKAILRALFANTKSGKTVQGGSTLTQQLVKNMLLTPAKTYKRKFQEMWLASEMEQMLTKDEILELYLNRISLGNRTFGVEAAAQRYYGKSAADLSLSESALLAALPKAPSRYDPTKNYDGAWDRAKLVLSNMHANNMISITELSEAETHLPVILQGTDSAMDQDIVGYFFDYVDDRAKALVGHDTKDLIVTTTLDRDLQQQAHDSLIKNLEKNEEYRKVSEGAIVLIENESGAILAMVGGRDYAASKFNRAASALRQPGSSFKAFVYAAALEQGLTPGTVRVDTLRDLNGWVPENYTKRYRGPMTIREALQHSINTIAAQVGAEVGPQQIVAIATRFGIKSPLKGHLSIALGTSEVTLVEMTGAYTVFANGGLKRQPYYITEVRNTAGELLYQRKDIPSERVFAKVYADQMVEMLRGAIVNGTARGAKMGNREVAGKTGTSQDHRDAWFIGFSADYTAGVWMGNDDNSPMNKVTGGLMPTDVWKDYMYKVHKGIKYKPLLLADNTQSDSHQRRRMDFYGSLVQDLVRERNLAAGIDAPVIGQPAVQLNNATQQSVNGENAGG